jgi:superfamily II RNA helicase
MAPPKGSIFDPAIKWEEEKERRRLAVAEKETEEQAAAAKGKKGGKGGGKKKSTADSIKESNAADKTKKDHSRDLEKLSNLRTLKQLQDTSCDTMSGKIHRIIKILHLAASDLRQGVVGSSEAEVLDILWALEEMQAFKAADEEVNQERALKKDEKKSDKDKKDSKKDSKKDKKDDKKSSKKDKKDDKEVTKIVLSAEGSSLKSLYKDGGDNRGSYKDSLKYSRKLMSGKENLISFQLTDMADRLPPLSRYNRQFKLEPWQCAILEAIDNRESAVVCAPTSSGKTLLSTYTCKNAKGTVLFVLPSEVLVWQVASTYYQFFKGNVTVCTDQITFQEVTGDAQVYIGTPRALEKSLSKVRGCAGDEMVKGEREFMILDGGYNQFDYLVLDEVHTLNGPEGDALQRIIKACNCPVLALSATIGNAVQLKDWFSNVLNEHIDATVIEAPEEKADVILKEHYARFINLQRYVVADYETKDGKTKKKLVKLQPVAAMTAKRLREEPELVAALSMTPSDMMDLWKRLRAIFPSTVLEELDNPDNFFAQYVDESKRITLDQTKEYETRLKVRLTALSQSHADLYEKLRVAQVPPPLESKKDVSDDLYDVVEQLKTAELLPAVAFQLSTYGAFDMFKTLLGRLESEQLAEFPSYRVDLMKVAREKAQMRKVAAGKADRQNAAEAEEDAKSGFVDESMVNEDTTKPHEKYVLSSAGKRLNFNEVEDIMADMKKSGEKVHINHALIRGLRRGIAIYTNEVGFSCYRRQVQMLAQQGRLAVVFSDAALAYGVNMPFRSCIFCGDMGEELTPLIAQQMQGRAGRRGMDVQGNIIYLGMEWSYIENLMLGQISHVTGKEPRYPTMALQGALAASNDPDDVGKFIHDDAENKAFAIALRKMQRYQHCYPTVTEQQVEWMCSTTLGDFCEGKTSDHYMGLSTSVIQGLGYIHEDGTLAMDHNVLSMVWEMHETLPIAIHLCAVLEQLYLRFCFQKGKSFKESDSTQNDFLSVLVHVVDRHPAKEGDESLQEMLRIEASEDGKLNEDLKQMWLETEVTLRNQKGVIDAMDIPQYEKDKMLFDMPPATEEGGVGPALDKGMYEVHFRRMFSNIKYSVSDMMNQLTDQEDLTEI